VTTVGVTPSGAVIAEDIRNLESGSRHQRSALPRRWLILGLLLCLLARLIELIERALDGGDHAGGDARVARRRIQFVVTQNRLNHPDIGAALQQMRREAVAQRVQRDRLLDPGHIGGLMEQAAELAGGDWRALAGAGEQPAMLLWNAGVVTDRALWPPFAQQGQHLGRQHDIAVLAAFRLHDADDHLRAVDIADPEPDHLVGTQAATVGDRQHNTRLDARCHSQDALDLVRVQHQWQLQGLFDMKDLGRQIVTPERDAEQKSNAGHDPVAITDARTTLDQMQLKQPHIVGGCRIRRALQVAGKTFTTRDVAALAMAPELARIHVLDHALPQLANNRGRRGTHGGTPEWGW
jgi:hypothetical protein